MHAFHGNKVDIGKKLKQWQWQGLRPLAVEGSLMQRKSKPAALEGLAKAMQYAATMLSSTCTRHTTVP